MDIAGWIAAALDLLATHGIEGVGVVPLARRLNVTKGSFYWHFKDRDALHKAMLAEWCRRVKSDMTALAAGNEDNAKMRLRRFLQISLADTRARHDADLELAVRLWGRRDGRVSEALAEV